MKHNTANKPHHTTIMKNAKYTSAAMVLLLSGICSLRAQNVEYTTTDFSNKLSPLKLSVTTAFNVGINGGLLVQGAKGKLGYNVNLQHAISKKMLLPKDNVVNPDNISAIKYFEAGLDFFFADVLKERGARVKVETSGNMYSSTYFRALCNKRKLTGLHGGLIRYNQTVAGKNTGDGLYDFKILNGVAPNQDQVFYFNTISNYIYAGLVFKKVIKSTVHSDGWKYFRHQARRIYMDMLMGGTSFDEISTGTNVYTLGTKQPGALGYRLGFEWDQQGVVTCFEIGQRPRRYALGLPGYNYVLLSFSFNFYHSDKTYAMSKKYTEKK